MAHRRMLECRGLASIPVTVVAVATLFAAGALGAEDLSVQLFDDRVEVAGATPQGEVALISVQCFEIGFSSRLATDEAVAVDADSDGVVTYPLDQPPAESSLWVAVDVASARFGSGSPIEAAPFAFESSLGRTLQPGGADWVVAVDGRSHLELLLLRPGAAWSVTWVDGGLSEGTELADGRLTLLEPAWEPLGQATEPPGALQPSDLLVALEPSTFSLDAALVGGLDELP